MFFKEQLLYILRKYDGQRTVFSAYHLLKGKKSGQTIQDVGLFDLYPYFNLLPKLTKEIYMEQVQLLQENKAITINEQQMIVVNKEIAASTVYFDGWHLRGGEHVFFTRLQLIVQTISNNLYGERKFLPIVRDERIQFFVRSYLKYIDFREKKVQQQFTQQLYTAVEAMETTETVKNIIMYRLTGYEAIGWTWLQLAEELGLAEIDVQLYYVHGLHSLIQKIEEEEFSLLKLILQNIRVQTVLTESTQKTAFFLNQGYTLEQIAERRRLKLSTIEDHIAELAMTDQQFDISQFVSDDLKEEIKRVIVMSDSKKLKPIKELVPHATYFQIRLILAVVGGE